MRRVTTSIHSQRLNQNTMHQHRMNRSSPRSRTRRGGVTVELALTAGLAFFFFFAALEFSRVAMIRHAVDHAAYEAARVGIIAGATAEQVDAKARQVLATNLMRNMQIQVSPNPIQPTSTTISVSIVVPFDQNLFAPALYFGGRRFERTFTMQRELATRL